MASDERVLQLKRSQKLKKNTGPKSTRDHIFRIIKKDTAKYMGNGV